VERDEVAMLFGPAGTTPERNCNSSLLTAQSKRVAMSGHEIHRVMGIWFDQKKLEKYYEQQFPA
jgi:hypothetical protein